MRTPKSFTKVFAVAESIEEVLVRMGMAETHARIRSEDASYAVHVEELIAGGIRDNHQGETTGHFNLDRIVQALDRGAFTQMALPFPQEQMPREPLERILGAIEAVMPVLWVDADHGDVTIRLAVKMPDLLAQAISRLHANAAILRNASDRANWLYAALLEVASRVDAGKAAQ